MAAAVAVGALTVFKPVAVAAAVGTLLVVMLGPLCVPIAALGIEEQLSSGQLSNLSVHPAVSVGSDIVYRATGPGLLGPACLAFAGLVVVRVGTRLSIPLGLALGGAAYSGALAFSQGEPLRSLQYATSSWLLLSSGIIIGGYLSATRRRLQTLERAVAALVCLKALIAIWVIVGGGAQIIGGRPLQVFYDSTLAAVAGSVVVVLLARPAVLPRVLRIATLIAGLLLLVLSFRRAVWIGSVSLLLFLLVIGRMRARFGLRVAVIASAVIFGAGAFGTLQAGALERATSVVSALSGGPLDQSSEAHATDVAIGWQYVLSSPVTGIGVNTPQIAGLNSVAASRLYVHSEYLQAWLRYGIVGLLLEVALLGIGVWLAVRCLRAPHVDFGRAWMSGFLLMSPVVLLAFPFVTQTVRWPLLMGLAMGVLHGMSNVARRPSSPGILGH